MCYELRHLSQGDRTDNEPQHAGIPRSGEAFANAFGVMAREGGFAEEGRHAHRPRNDHPGSLGYPCERGAECKSKHQPRSGRSRIASSPIRTPVLIFWKDRSHNYDADSSRLCRQSNAASRGWSTQRVTTKSTSQALQSRSLKRHPKMAISDGRRGVASRYAREL